MLISEMIEEIRTELPLQLQSLYKAHASMKDDWRFRDLNALRQRRIDELEKMASEYGMEYLIK